MKHSIVLVFLLFVNSGHSENQGESDKIGQLKNLLKKIGLQQLPFRYDLTKSSNNGVHYVDLTSRDRQFVTSGIFGGVLPDTTKFYCILYYQPGDSLYPFLTTIDKKGNVIDDKMIGVGYCGGLASLDVITCVDQVTINSDLSFDLFYKVTGTAEIDSTKKVIPICNSITGSGRIDETGRIIISRGESVDCN